jgi:hypothetical protein
MKFAAVLLALAGSAAAFAPSAQPKTSLVVAHGALDGIPGSTNPIPQFDPLNLAECGTTETLNWFRAAELKNGRTAMVAVTGYLVQGAGIHFPGMLSIKQDISFESLSSLKPMEQWAAVPAEGKAQILLTCLIAELVTEARKPHYMKGGPMPTIVFPMIDFSGVDAETLKRRQDSELNNGRLAMIAIMSFFSAAYIPGSVPALINNPAF